MKLRLEFTAEEWQSLAEDCEHVGTCGHLTSFHDHEGWCCLCEAWPPDGEPETRRRPIRIVFPVDLVLPDPPIDVGGREAKRLGA